MITLITGTPGAGKTLYTVANLLRELVGSEVDSVGPDGKPCKIPRVVFTNINDLMLDHEKIDGRVGGGLADWHKWVKPGNVICYDEVQKEWPVRPNGSKVPDFIQALETHRHMGCDFIIITQGPQLIDQNVRALVGRHLHVRRMGGVAGSIVYEWDHCSRQLIFSQSMSKKPFRYPKDVFTLYKSSELHTKPKMAVPGAIYVVGLALVAAVAMVPYIKGRIDSKSEIAAAPDKAQKPETVSGAAPGQKPAKTVVASENHIKPPAFPRVIEEPEKALPAPPVPVDAFEYMGQLVTSAKRIYLFKKPGGGLIQSDNLLALGYKLESADDCSVTLSHGKTERTFLCALGPTTPGPARQVNPDIQTRMAALSRPPVAVTPPQWVASDGMAYARQRQPL
jgi:zona occludens toxin